MTTKIELLPLPERFNYTNSSAHWCYSRYTMVRDDLGAYVRAEDYDALRNAAEALRAEVERLKSMAAVTMGVGSGGGNLFVHGDYESIKAAQAIVLERGTLRAEVDALKVENEKLREVLKDADNEMDWLDEEMDTCDHSVGVCMCSYWNMRRKMKAVLEKENRND